MRTHRTTIGILGIALCAAGIARGDAPPSGIRGWFVTGPGDGAKDFKLTDYEGGLDASVRHGGRASAYLQSKVAQPAKHAVVMQSIASDHYRGKRVRLSAWIRTDGATEGAALWMRVVPQDRDQTFARAAVPARAPEWTRYEVVLDVAPESHSIMFGLSLQGAGRAWIDDVRWEVVDKNVPTTPSGPQEPLEPENLDFEG